MKLRATVELVLDLDDSTDPSKITNEYLAAILAHLIELDPEPVVPFGFSEIRVTHINPEW